MQDEVWRKITSFEEYSVSDLGRVRNDHTDRILRQNVNQYGVPNVGLILDHVQYKRAVGLLVAKEFVPRLPHQREAFNTPINLNGDRCDNSVRNLMWRPRWFARDYFQQFEDGPRGFRVPVQDVASKEVFPTSWEAAVRYGLLDHEIYLATLNRTYVWPTYQTFRVA